MPLIRNTPEKPAGGGKPIDDSGEMLTSASADARWAAARAAAGRVETIPALAQALAIESEPRVREAIFTALARTATSESVDVVLLYLRSDVAALRTAALDSLRAMPSATKPHLRALLGDSDSDVRLLACDLAREMTGNEAQDLLCALLETEAQPNVCAAAVDVLAEIGDAGAIDTLARCASRFPQEPFLAFAIKTASDRLSRRADSD